MRTNLFTLSNSKLIKFSSEGLSKQRTYRLPDADAQLAGDVVSATSETNLTGILSGNGSVISAITTSSGALVFANTPTLVTPIIGTASSTRILNGDGTTAAPAYSFTSDPDTGIISSAANAIGFVTGATERWSINSSGSLNPIADNTNDIGNGLVNPRDINISRNLVKKGIAASSGYGELSIKSFSVTQAVSGASSSLAITIPTGSVIIAAQLRNDTTILGEDDSEPVDSLVSYSAAYNASGASQVIDSAITLAINNKINKFFDVNADSNITTGSLAVVLTPNVVGGGTMLFTSGTVTVVVYYYELTSLTNVS